MAGHTGRTGARGFGMFEREAELAAAEEALNLLTGQGDLTTGATLRLVRPAAGDGGEGSGGGGVRTWGRP